MCTDSTECKVNIFHIYPSSYRVVRFNSLHLYLGAASGTTVSHVADIVDWLVCVCVCMCGVCVCVRARAHAQNPNTTQPYTQALHLFGYYIQGG